MTPTFRIVAIPEEGTHPERLVAAIEAVLRRVCRVEALAHRIDHCVGSGEWEATARVEVAVGGAVDGIALERTLADTLERGGLPAALSVCTGGFAPSGPVRGGNGAAGDASAGGECGAVMAARHDVRRLIQLVPPGSVTTVAELAGWTAIERETVIATIGELVGARDVPWHRITDAGGRLDTLEDGRRLRAQTARLEAERIPVRFARVIGFPRYFVDARRLRSV